MPSNYKTVINFRDGIQVDTDDLISNNGLVGIGSTIPRQQLDVRGNIIVDENTELNNLKVTGVTTFFNVVNVASGSSVGIGTTIPEAAFQVGIGSTGFTVTEEGDVVGKSFTGDGSALTGIPASVWVNPGAGDTIYSEKIVGIGTTLTRGNAGFGVGYEIYMDPVAGVGTFEGIVTKNITVTNSTGAGQGNVNADVGTFSTVTATTQITAPTFIGTVTNAVRSVVAAGLTDSPDVAVNYITGVGGTFTGITSFTTFQATGGIVGSAGIITATTFSGSATTAAHAAIAYGIGGDPDIQVDQLTVNGTAPSIIRGTGVSTVGQDLIVGSFLGVGATESATGQAAGFIGTVRVHQGDLILGGSISIGGSLVGSVELGSTQNINVLNVGAGLSVAGITTLTGTVTGGADLNITGSVTGREIDATESSNIGGGQTVGGSLVVGAAVSGSTITVLNGGGMILGSGITMGGPISGATALTMSGPIEGVTDLVMNGTLSGITSIAANGQITGVSDLAMTSGNITGVGSLAMSGSGGITGVSELTGVTYIGMSSNGSMIGVGSIIGSGIWQTGSKIIADEVHTENIYQSLAGISTFGEANITDLHVEGGKVYIDKNSGIISATAFYAPSGVSTFTNIRLTNGQDTYINAKYIGINTIAPAITHGVEVYGGAGEISVGGETFGVGIGSTAGARQDDSKLYVGYGRSQNGSLENAVSIFECGNIGIGTTAVDRSTDGVENIEIYRNIKLYGTNTGVGGTAGIGTNIIQIGFNTEQPAGALDMRYADGPLCLPVAEGDQDGSEISYFHHQGDSVGNLWFSKFDMSLKVGMGNGSANYIGLKTESPGRYDETYSSRRGFAGPIVPSEALRDTEVPLLPVEEPVGWNTSNVVYYLPTDQFQHRSSAGNWISHVGSATTGVEIIIDGTTAILNVAGIGSVSLGTLS